jgi:acetyl-CoA carboxylase biotin carboxyl carrier protein
MTDLKTLKQLIKLMVDNDLTELDMEGEGEKVKLKRGGDSPQVHMVASPGSVVSPSGVVVGASSAADAASGAPGSAGGASDATAGQAEADGNAIVSPMVGTFYAAATPDAKAFVSVGDQVDEETVVCIIEAMKVFNEIKAETRGVITKTLVENGQAVQFDQPMFEVKPQ